MTPLEKLREQPEGLDVGETAYELETGETVIVRMVRARGMQEGFVGIHACARVDGGESCAPKFWSSPVDPFVDDEEALESFLDRIRWDAADRALRCTRVVPRLLEIPEEPERVRR